MKEKNSIKMSPDTVKTAKHATEEFNKIHTLFMSKLADYGTKDLVSMGQILQRITEKMSRIHNLLSMQRLSATGETIIDTLRDIAGYSIIASLLEQDLWGGESHVGVENREKFMALSKSIQIYKAHKDATLASPQKNGDVGYDLYVNEDTEIPRGLMSNRATLILSKIHIKIPDGYFCIIMGRSSAANKLGLMVVPAVIDNGYTGELSACVFNMTPSPIKVSKGERVAQLVFFPMCLPQMINVEKLPKTERKMEGFGSTGA